MVERMEGARKANVREEVGKIGGVVQSCTGGGNWEISSGPLYSCSTVVRVLNR